MRQPRCVLFDDKARWPGPVDPERVIARHFASRDNFAPSCQVMNCGRIIFRIGDHRRRASELREVGSTAVIFQCVVLIEKILQENGVCVSAIDDEFPDSRKNSAVQRIAEIIAAEKPGDTMDTWLSMSIAPSRRCSASLL